MSVNQVNQTTGALSPIAGGTLYADAPVGSIQAYGGATAPWGWLLCQGQAVSRATYAELFNVIGTSFGSGDGSTTFNVPDLRGEFLRGAGTNSHSGQGSGGSVGQHQDATQIPDIYLAAGGSTIVTPGVDSLFTNTDAAVSQSSGYKQINVGTGSTTNIPKTFAVRPTNTSVNFIIKATTIALPSDFEAAVDEKIADNMIDSITDGNMKAATSNAVYDALNAMETMSPGGGVVHQHWGHMNCITCHWQASTPLTAMTWNTISTLTKYRPSQVIYFHATTYNQDGPAYGMLEPSGALKIFPVVACAQVYTAVTYMNP